MLMFFWGLGISLALQVILPVALALLVAPWRGIVCSYSLHGRRSVPCSMAQLISEAFGNFVYMNLSLGGLPTFFSFGVVAITFFLGTFVISMVKKLKEAGGKRGG